MYLSTILDDYSRDIIAWKLCTTMKTSDVTETLDLALQASGCDQAHVVRKPRLLSDNGSSYASGELAEWLGDKKMGHVRGALYHPQTHGKIERWHQTLKNRILLDNYFSPGRPRSADRRIRRSLQSSAIPREHQQPYARRRPLQAWPSHFKTTGEDQAEDDRNPALAIPQIRRLIS